MNKRLSAGLINACLFLAPFLLLEGVFRLLPVGEMPALQTVSAENPVVRYEPNVDYRYSRDWNFSIVTHRHSNNYGFIHATDYRAHETAPLMTIIGTSFVEANVVDAGKGVAELLDSTVAGTGRVYGLGVSGTPLSQYLVFADYARRTFRPQAMTFVINNNLHLSFLRYGGEPRFHYFTEDGSLQRVDYRLTAARSLLRHSAALRYVMYNLDAPHRIDHFLKSLRQDPFASEAAALEQHVTDSKRAVDYFFDQLPAASGLAPQSILFVLDAVRPAMYSAAELAKVDNGLHARLRRYITAQAVARGYQVIDMQPVFIARYELDGTKVEAAPTDSHWNAVGHRIVAGEIGKSAVFARTFERPAGSTVRVAAPLKP
jgi:hypothetical protein